MQYKKGFTLIEILVASAIVVVVLAVLVIPNVMRSRINANETTTIQFLNALHQALDTYSRTHNIYPTKISFLITPSPPYLSAKGIVITSESDTETRFTAYGYRFVYKRNQIYNYKYYCEANPIRHGVSGNRSFRIDQHGCVTVWRSSQWTPL